jgi:hypothetical protein
MKRGTLNMLLYAGISVAAIAVLAIMFYGSPAAAAKSMGIETYDSMMNEEPFMAGEEEEPFEDAPKKAHVEHKEAEEEKEDEPEKTEEGFYGGYDSGVKSYAAAGESAGRKSVPSTDYAHCYTRDGLNPSDLLPKASPEASQFLASNPPTKGSPDARNLLEAGYHIGIDTVCQTNKNPNLQLRSDPPIARCGTQPIFNSSSIPAQQNNRLALEIGSQINPTGCEDYRKSSA